MVDQVAGLSLGVDVSQVQNAAKSLKQLGEAAKAGASGLESFVNEAEVAKQRAKEQAAALKQQKKEYAGIAAAIDPAVAKLDKLRDAAGKLDELWKQGVVPDEEFFRLGEMIEGQTNKLIQTQKALTEEGQAAIAEANAKKKATNQANAFLESLQGQVDAIGKTESELMELKAAQLGVSAQAAPLIAQLKGQAQEMKLAGISAGQYKMAMRQLPAQITDVVTSLASGMPVWMVAIQQGGQIKDSFGGVVNTFKALLSFVNPVTVVMGALVAILGGMAKAAYDSYTATKQLGDNLVLTGNYANMTTGEVDKLASSLSKSSDATVGMIKGIAAEFAGSGKYTENQIKTMTKTTAEWAAVSGHSKDEIVSAFDAIANDPVQGLAKLNEQFNFLKEGQLTYIENLRKTKGETAAVEEATKLFADTMDKRLADIAASATPLEKMWNDVKKWASDAWGWVGDHTVGALNLIVDTVSMVINQIQLLISKGDAMIGDFVIGAAKKLQKIPGMGEFGKDFIAGQEEMVAKAKKTNAELEKEIREQQARIAKGEMGYVEQMKSRGGDNYSAKTKEAVKKEAEKIKDVNKAKKESVDIGDKITTQYEADILALETQLQVLKDHKTVNQGISQQRKELWATEAKIKILEEESSKRALSKDEKSLLANKEKVLALANQKAIIGDQIEQQKKANELHDQSVKYIQKINEEMKAAQETNGLSANEKNRAAELAKLTAMKTPGMEDQEIAQIDAMIAKRKEYYAQEDELRMNWQDGMSSAWDEYGEKAMNVTGNVHDIMASALSGMTDQLAEFVMTGKANFADFAKSIISMIIKMIMQMVIFNTLSGLMGGKTMSMGSIIGGGGKSVKSQPMAAAIDSPMSQPKQALAQAVNVVASRSINAASAAPAPVAVTTSAGSGVAIGEINVDVNNGNDPKGIEGGVRQIFNEMINEACSQGGRVYNYIQEKTGG